MHRSHAVAFAIVGSSLAAVIAYTVTAGGDPEGSGRRAVGGPRTVYGGTISMSAAFELIDACECPAPASEGAARRSNIVRAWSKDDEFGFVFVGGMTLSYEWTSESPGAFAERIRDSLDDPDEAGPIGRLIPLSGAEAWVKELDAHGPAFVEWIEGGHELTLIGGSVHELSILIEAATGLS